MRTSTSQETDTKTLAATITKYRNKLSFDCEFYFRTKMELRVPASILMMIDSVEKGIERLQKNDNGRKVKTVKQVFANNKLFLYKQIGCFGLRFPTDSTVKQSAWQL